MKILLIEDDLDDVELLEEALHSKKVCYQIVTKTDGSAATDYIRACIDNPDIIIMDLNIPKIHGKDILLHIKSINGFKNIPVLILTTSSAKEDIEYVYKHGANEYLKKPTSLQQINDMVDSVLRLAKKSTHFVE